MKDKIRKIICSIMPFWVESLYVRDRYDLRRIPVFWKAILMLLPSAFLYIVSNYNSSDKRKIKYWLPYGLMRDFQLRTHGKRIENKKHFFVCRFIRWLLPYGYVLWWDGGERQPVSRTTPPANRPAAPAPVSGNNANNNAAILSALQAESEKNRVLQMELAERLEVSLLKLAVELKQQNT